MQYENGKTYIFQDGNPERESEVIHMEDKKSPAREQELKERIFTMEKENAELKRELEERQMCLCIPLEKISFFDPLEEESFQKLKIDSTRKDDLKLGLRIWEDRLVGIRLGCEYVI